MLRSPVRSIVTLLVACKRGGDATRRGKHLFEITSGTSQIDSLHVDFDPAKKKINILVV
jgi:hypothetical protein